MFRSARARFTATLIVSVLGFVMTLDDPTGRQPDTPLALRIPR